MIHTIQNFKTSNLNPGFEFQQLLVSLKHVINLVMQIRYTGCHILSIYRLHMIILASIISLTDLSASLCLYVVFTGKILFGSEPPTIHHSFQGFTSRFFSTKLMGALN
jgi:hypothetical protein